MTTISLRPVTSKTAQDRDSVTMGRLQEIAYAASYGHVADDVTDPERLTS